IRPVATGDEPDEAVLLRHEERFWKRMAASAGLGDLSLRGRRRLVATATLCVARDGGHAAEILGRLRWPSPPERDAVASWLGALHPSDRGFWSPLRPDRVGEYLVGLALDDEPTLLEQLLPTADPEESRGALHVLARSASHQHHVAGLLEQVITANPSRLAPVAVGVATAVERPEPLHRALAIVAEEAEDDLVLLEQVYDAVPDHSQTLAVWAAELAGRIAELVSLDVQTGAKEIGDLAAALTRQAFRLDLAGHPEFALPRYETSVRIYDQLARHTPGRYETDLATSIEGYAHQLYAAGERKKAAETIERAVELRREHADSAEERRLLADTLTGYGNHLSASGQFRQAVTITQEAVDLYRTLPDAVRATSDRQYASALMTHAIALQENGRIVHAVDAMRHAVAAFRSMTKRFPDAHRSDLAAALANFAVLLADAEQLHEALARAEESVGHYEELAVALPGAHEANHAAALHCLASRLADLEQWPEAAQRAEQAVALLEVVTAHGDEHSLELGTALDMWAIALSECKRTDEAVGAGRRSVDVLRSLNDDIAVRVQLGTTLRNFAEVLREAGRAAEASPYSAEAVELWQALAAEAPGVLEDELRLALLVHDGVVAELSGAGGHGLAEPPFS
ncbi:tetratricopeptide repeat protein, partial [Lentzea sp.]|uniref:tetratricopeptide repeat protein n=1 Tax=Lentzea sp. TaxID=56099 RepID=UPI002C4A3840